MSITANYLYNAMYQLISIAIPFITTPYVSRVLGAHGIGINAYAGSILQYFILFGSLGIGLYAARSIAYIRDDKECLSKTFWSIFMLQFFLCTISLVVYIAFVIFFVKQFRLIYIILSINLLAAAIDITWLFVGIEEFKKLVIRSIFIRILGAACIFIFISDFNDVWKYTAISSLSVMSSQMVLWVYIKRIVWKYKVRYRDIIIHIRPSLELFVPQIAIQVYLVLNRTMLGYIAGSREIGLYESSDKVIRMSVAIITAMGGVMLPRVSNSFANGDNDKVEYYIYNALNFVSYLAIPMMLGLAGISVQFVPWFFGSEFVKCSILIVILCPTILSIAWSNVLGYQYMIPTKKTIWFTISVIIGALVNFTLNLILVKRFHSTGTAAAAMLTEASVAATQFCLLRKYIRISIIRQNLIKYFSAGIMMFIIVILIGYSLGQGAKTTFIQIPGGIAVYVLVLSLLKSDVNSMILSRLYRRIIKRFISREARG